MKQKKIKLQKYESEDTKEIKSLIIITLIIAVIGFGLYFLTDKILDKDATPVKAEFDYTIATVGTIFNRPYNEYYVFLYESDSENSAQYDALRSTYEQKEDAKKIYYVDMSLKMNKEFLSDTSNKTATKASDIKIKDSALILIKNGKISKYYETLSEYKEKLS